jgi:hydrogenase maturation protease
MKKKVALIGLGNILMRDEGIGVHAVEALRKRYCFSADFDLIDGGTLGLDLLPLLEGIEKILFLDALDLKKQPGTVAVLEDEEIPSFLRSVLSFHQVGLSDLLFASKLMGIKPSKVMLIGMQPEKVETGLALSETVLKNFEKYIQKILEKLREWGIESIKNDLKGVEDVPGRSF